ncbi:5-oxoprolinase subunit PxpA [Parvularcula bermudensis]|nr:5-oxoprolinase subunit PxpA [Parvularcula bermudensis]
MRPTIDLNADVGEGMGDDRALIPLVSSVNIACGGHAGTPETMRRAVDLADRSGVGIGAHPAYPDREGFGRRSMDLSPTALREALISQIEALVDVTTREAVGHVKPHGALYNDAHKDKALAALMVDVLRMTLPSARLVGPPGGELEAAAMAVGLVFTAEGFVDRAYAEDGSLIPRSEEGAVLVSEADRLRQAISLGLRHEVETLSGETIGLRVQTLCLHGDSDGAVASARAVRAALLAAGLDIERPGLC